MRRVKIKVYAPFCIQCVYPASWGKIQKWADNNGIRLDVRRTNYNPIFHSQATRIFGNENYGPFLAMEDGPVLVKEFAKQLGKEEKGAKKEELSKVRRTARIARAHRKVATTKSTNKGDQKRTKR